MAARRPAAPEQAVRLVLLAWRLARGEGVTTAQVRKEFGVSVATAKRDVALLDRVLRGRKVPQGQQPRRMVLAEDRRSVRLLGAD